MMGLKQWLAARMVRGCWIRKVYWKEPQQDFGGQQTTFGETTFLTLATQNGIHGPAVWSSHLSLDVPSHGPIQICWIRICILIRSPSRCFVKLEKPALGQLLILFIQKRCFERKRGLSKVTDRVRGQSELEPDSPISWFQVLSRQPAGQDNVYLLLESLLSQGL